jgi:mono/diheme cytochrome c family protein
MIGLAARGMLSRRIAATIGLVGVASLSGPAAQAQQNRRWTAPPAAAQRTNPLVHRPDAERGGRKVFHERCAMCHGPDAEGTDKGPSLTARRVRAQSDGALFWKITQGNTHGGMPTFSFLPEPQRWQLVLHLRAAGTRSP